eukprot:1118373-Rhodomonas_salina.1
MLLRYDIQADAWERITSTSGRPPPAWKPSLGCAQQLVGKEDELWVVGACGNTTGESVPPFMLHRAMHRANADRGLLSDVEALFCAFVVPVLTASGAGEASHVMVSLDLASNAWGCQCHELGLPRGPVSRPDTMVGYSAIHFGDSIFFFGGVGWVAGGGGGPPSIGGSICEEEEGAAGMRMLLGLLAATEAVHGAVGMTCVCVADRDERWGGRVSAAARERGVDGSTHGLADRYRAHTSCAAGCA